jgi:hypothetical protein
LIRGYIKTTKLTERYYCGESEGNDREESDTTDVVTNALLKSHTPDKFEQQKQIKLLLERGKEIFRLHPKKVSFNANRRIESERENENK